MSKFKVKFSQNIFYSPKFQLKKKFKNLFEIKNIIIPDPDQFYHIV